MYLFFDTETTGLPKNFKAPVTNTDNWPRMVQLAWQVYDENGRNIDFKNFIIKPEGYTIPLQVSKIHRITTERALKEGHPLEEVLLLFSKQIDDSDTLVAHNMGFDEKIAGAEFIRKNIDNRLFNKKRLCTMQASTYYCQIPGPYGFKWPKLEELHQFLFGEKFIEAHDASVDIAATARCFWELRKKGIL